MASIDFTVVSMSEIFWRDPHRRSSLAFISAMVGSMMRLWMGGEGSVGEGVWSACRLFLTIRISNGRRVNKASLADGICS